MKNIVFVDKFAIKRISNIRGAAMNKASVRTAGIG